MLRKHAPVVAMIDHDRTTSYLLRDYFSLPRDQSMLEALTGRGLFQADLVLALLRLRDRHAPQPRQMTLYIELLIGHPIVVGPPCLTQYRAQSLVTHVVRSKDDRRIIYVAPVNPRQPQTTPFFQWREYRVGRTIGQIIARGITKRDVRRAINKGWVRVEA